jgi:hypothetical protein
VPANTSWTLISFKWKNGNWRYQTVSLFVLDIDHTCHRLTRLEFNQASTSLGVEIAPDGNMEAQVSRLTKASSLWVAQIATSKLGGPDTWIALTSTLWKTLGYPLQTTSMTRVACEKIMAPAITQGLRSMGFCRNFPHALVHAPIE